MLRAVSRTVALHDNSLRRSFLELGKHRKSRYRHGNIVLYVKKKTFGTNPMFSHPRSNSMLMFDLYAARLGECLSLFFGKKSVGIKWCSNGGENAIP